jgi:hypothetical protein
MSSDVPDGLGNLGVGHPHGARRVELPLVDRPARVIDGDREREQPPFAGRERPGLAS